MVPFAVAFKSLIAAGPAAVEVIKPRRPQFKAIAVEYKDDVAKPYIEMSGRRGIGVR